MKIITYNENTIQLHLINIDKIFRNIQMLILRIDSKTPLLVLFLDSEVFFYFLEELCISGFSGSYYHCCAVKSLCFCAC